MRHKQFIIPIIALALGSCQNSEQNTSTDKYKLTDEKHFQNIKMLTTEGENAEAYFSFDQQKLIYQSRHGKYLCDQIFTMNLDGSEKKLVSTGFGRTTCSFFYPDGKRFIFASTHAADIACPSPPDLSKGYVWKVYNTFDLYTASIDGADLQPLVPHAGYDAEATVSPNGDKVVFTSQRSGDLEIYSINLDGSELKQLTSDLGYDGGPFYSWDGKKIVYRSFHPKTKGQIQRYKNLLADELIEPAKFQIWIMDADGSNKRQVTNNTFANFAPFYHPDNERIIFCSNLNSENPRQPDFNLWMINEDGSGLEQITYFDNFDGFPMFSADGKKLVFSSNRFNHQPRDTNVFIADWID
jgi:Tol biopolymer transport system component